MNNEEHAKKVRTIIIKRMHSKDISIAKLAQLSHMSYKSLYHYIKGDKDIRSGDLLAVLWALKAKLLIKSNGGE